jgi:glycosyltransferase involved in cell wall biosynthesis
MNSNIVCIGLPTWEGDYQKPIVELMKELSSSHKILYVEYTRTLKDTKYPKKAVISKKYSRTGNEINVLTPPSTLPMNWINNAKVYDKVLNINARILKNAILKAMEKLNIENPIVLNAFQPAFGTKLIGQLNEKANYYFCYDELTEAKWCQKHLPNYEKEFLKKIKGALVTSEGLKANKIKYQANTHLLQNGVEIEMFENTLTHSTRNNVVGYLGTIDDRIDIKILTKSVKKYPHLDFIFIGRILDERVFKALENFPNVIFTGAKKPAELGYYLENMQIGIIPFVKNGFTKNIYPMKINQYLAYGMPVVTTDFADLSDFGDLIYYSAADKFVKNIENAINEKENEKFAERVAFAMNNTWTNKAIKLSNILES